VEAKLIVVDGDAKSRQYDLQLPTVIGRSRSTDLTLGHPLVSRQHCEVFESNGMLMVRDLGSLNGTFIGETRIAEQAMPVKPGDLLTVGPVTFQAVYLTGGKRTKRVAWDPTNATFDAPLPGQSDIERDKPNPPRRLGGEDDTSPPAKKK
jgi:pSer/pThr/pTyr-binding forkhead associated (FHA) protein